METTMTTVGGTPEQSKSIAGQAKPRRQSFLEAFVVYPDDRFDEKDNGLKVAVLREGSGRGLEKGQKLKVHYTGWLESGVKFDTSLKRNEPFEFVLGAGQVIKGWEEGMAGIKPGERRQLIIPADLAYGDNSKGKIPPGSTLIFMVEAVGIDSGSKNPKGNLSIVA